MAYPTSINLVKSAFDFQFNVVRPRPSLSPDHPEAGPDLPPRENDYRTPLSKYTADNEAEKETLQNLRGVLKDCGAFQEEYHLNPFPGGENVFAGGENVFASFGKTGPPMADILHVCVKTQKTAWQKKAVGPSDGGKLLLCHSTNCAFCDGKAPSSTAAVERERPLEWRMGKGKAKKAGEA